MKRLVGYTGTHCCWLLCDRRWWVHIFSFNVFVKAYRSRDTSNEKYCVNKDINTIWVLKMARATCVVYSADLYDIKENNTKINYVLCMLDHNVYNWFVNGAHTYIRHDIYTVLSLFSGWKKSSFIVFVCVYGLLGMSSFHSHGGIELKVTTLTISLHFACFRFLEII